MTTHIRPKKSLGQNFLKDPYYLHRIVEAARVEPADQILEIGPGLGHLTRVLAEKAGTVLALELDDRLIPLLRREFSANPGVDIQHADALEYDYESLSGTWKVVANLPYYISTPVIQRLLSARQKFTALSLMLQKEVAARIASGPGSREYGYLSVLVQVYAEPRIEFTVPAAAFTPSPEIDSSLITLAIRKHPAFKPVDHDFFIRVIKAAFSQRRKTLRNALKQLDIASERMASVSAETGIDLGRRAETLTIEEFGILADYLQASKI